MLADLGINQKRSRPNHPTTCGKVERFQQTLKKWLRAQPRVNRRIDLQQQIDTFIEIYNHHRPHRSLGRTTPHIAYNRLRKAQPGTDPRAEHRLRRDIIDNTGSNPQGCRSHIRHKGTLYKIGIGRAHKRRAVIALIDNLDIRIIDTQTGELLRDLALDTTRTYQPQNTEKT